MGSHDAVGAAVVIGVPDVAAAAVGVVVVDAVAVVFDSVVGIENGVVEHALICTGLDMVDMDLVEVDWAGMLALRDPSALESPIEELVYPEKLPAHWHHSFHAHGHWSPGFVLVEAAGILTWAEKDMPSNEHRRMPLWPNLSLWKIVPGLI